ncbi:hypothetical protein VitviT2T_016255 [Vitis vinifera]|uniref:Uncharacterized protein n=2 Tax=Vitis vinifera TaxID=29760 RepID=D7TCC9_VITVI|eukprot:XP_002277730.1 PREDICTED: protein trichome birefringence-like 14 [Vitis vinifera]
MKGGFYALRGKQLSLILLVLVCTTILIWAWEKTPLLTTLLPPQNRLLQLYPGPALESSSKPPIHKNKDISTSPEDKEVVNGQEEKAFSLVDQLNPEKSSPGIWNSDSNVITPSDEKKGDPINVPKEESRDNRVPEGKSSSKKAEDVDLVVAAPISSANKSSSLEGKEYKNSTISAGNQACNYAIGKWVEDDSRPFYSGFECKQWLSPMWACRLTERTDFAYEKFQWRPKNCKMDKFTGSNFLRRMQDKTLAFIGDSLGRQQFQSLMCMITGGKESPDVTSVGWKYGLVKARGALRPDGWAYWFPGTNTTILYYWSASLCDLEPLNSVNPTMDYAMHLDRPPAFLRRFLNKFDVLVLNTGHHWNRGKLKANRWVMHVGGVPNTDTKIAEIGGAKNLTIHSIVKWVDSQLPKYPGLKAFYRTISPRHFFNGDWNTGGSCDNTTPLSDGKEVLKDESLDPVAVAAVKGTRVKLLDITASSQLRDEGHISRYSIRATPGVQDCLHWCLPGIPDMWNEILFAQL